MDRSTPEKKLTLLAVLAHPDDESFGMGGTLALYARREVDVHLVCATRGEVGDVEPERLKGFESLADLREHELRCAAKKLGLAGVHFLGYRDSGMPGSPDNKHPKALAAAPLDEVAANVACYIRMLRPQVVITFDPIGGYRHPDHIAIHEATVKAFHHAGDPEIFGETDALDDYPPYQPEKLYFHTIPRGLLRWAVRLMPLFGEDPRRFGQNEDVDLLSLSSESFPIHARINYSPVKALKDDASACHASQGGGIMLSKGPLGWAYRLTPAVDTYMRAYPPASPGLRERDLFAGVNGAS
jgi:LmbE family N-acetylglucosaminyl deacetylase